jgi:SepF-like predicted cell division protein (DUF552 family)
MENPTANIRELQDSQQIVMADITDTRAGQENIEAIQEKMKANQKKIEANQEKTDATIKLAWNK